MNNGDSETVRKEAHSIKGGSANLCATQLSTASSALEEAGKADDYTCLDDLFSTLQDQLSKLKEFAKAL